MNRRALANGIGCLSMAFSLGFWVPYCIERMIGRFPLAMPFSGWVLTWLLGFLLALIAAIYGSRRWALAAILPILSYLMVLRLLDKIP